MDFNVVDGYVKAGFWIDYKNLKSNLTKSGDYLWSEGQGGFKKTYFNGLLCKKRKWEYKFLLLEEWMNRYADEQTQSK